MPTAVLEHLRPWLARLRTLKNLPPIMKLGWKTNPWLITAGLSLRLASAVVPVAMLWVGKLIIDQIVAGIKHTAVDPHRMWILLAIEFLLAVTANFIWRAVDYFDTRLTDEFTRAISLRIMEHATRLDLQSFEDPAFYDKLERARSQATDRTAMLRSMGQFLQQVVTLCTLSAAVIAYSPLLLLILVFCAIPAFLGESHFAFLGYTLSHELTPAKREMDYLRLLGSSKEGAKEVKVFGLGYHLQQKFDQLNCTVIGKNKAMAQSRLKWCFSLGMFGSIGYYLAYAYLVFRAMKGDMTVGTLTFLSGTLAGCNIQLQSVFSTFSSIADQTLFLSDLIDFLAVSPKIRSKQHAFPAPRPIRDGFEFRKVSFQYPGSSRLILNNLDLRIAAGERVALVGENGQGKTTFVKLLARLYDPTGGAIFLDGVDLRDYKVEDLRREVGVIFQDFMRYDMSARANIGVGRIEALDNDELLHSAARRSHAEEVLAKLPDDLDQMLGRRFEGGVDLSGGEWQKIAIARAYLRDAQLLILDEPTSALDAAAELDVFERFTELTKGRTVLLISHRFSTVRIADRIVVIEGGRVSEQGTHRQLLDHNGKYASLFEMQASTYR
jgi:ATP-binding cassette, subfamily B, bacterial